MEGICKADYLLHAAGVLLGNRDTRFAVDTLNSSEHVPAVRHTHAGSAFSDTQIHSTFIACCCYSTFLLCDIGSKSKR